MEEKTKRCPFCGGCSEIVHGWNGWTVECDECAVNIGWFNSPVEAAEKWNQRYSKKVKNNSKNY